MDHAWVYLVEGFIASIYELYASFRLLNMKFNWNWKSILKLIISILILTSYLVIAYSATQNFARYIGSMILLILCLKMFYHTRVIEAIAASFLAWVILLIVEIVFSIIIIGAFSLPIEKMRTIYALDLLSNFIIFSTSGILISITPLRKQILKIMKKIEKIGQRYIIIMIILLALTFSISFYLAYTKVSPLYTLILTLVVVIIYTIITFGLFKEKNNSLVIKAEYDTLMKTMSEYEKMLDCQRVTNHENKNQLLIIRDMIQKNQNGITEYINTIVEEQREKSEEFLTKTKRVPSGGLQGIIYCKLLDMKEKKIIPNLSISKEIKFDSLSFLSVSEIQKLCKVMGVFLDNAIEETQELENDQKEITIEMYLENNDFVIQISNFYKGRINLEEMDQPGYTTKSYGHGYGLPLVREIISNNPRFSNERSISGKVFSQLIKIKM